MKSKEETMNILNLPPSEQQRIHIDRIASLAINNLRRGKLTRREVNEIIESSVDVEMMRKAVNFYRRVKQ